MATLIKDYYSAFLKSQQILLEKCVVDYPIDIYKLISYYSIHLLTLYEYEAFRKSTYETRPYIKIRDGRSIYDPNRKAFFIIYDDTKYAPRIRFTLAHELGHILLNHLDDERTQINRGGISNALYSKMEAQADTFAGNLLAPPIIIANIIANKPYEINKLCKFFGLSLPAIRYHRLNDFQQWLQLKTTSVEKRILKNFRNKNDPRYCETCHSQFFGHHFCFCKICGSRLDNFAGGKFVIYDKIETNDKGKAKKCPVCDNELTDTYGDFCQICGANITNKCIAGDAICDNNIVSCCEETQSLSGEARYCPCCGSQTTFFKNNYLTSWERIYKIPDDYPLIPDEDLPF